MHKVSILQKLLPGYSILCFFFEEVIFVISPYPFWVLFVIYTYHLDPLFMRQHMFNVLIIQRISAKDALDAEYFWTDPLPCDPKRYNQMIIL